MSVATTVVDLGVGNLGNVVRALTAAGGEPTITTDPGVLRAARRVVLPGVGAFRPPRERLRGSLEEALRSALADGAFLLGICVGYQLLFAGSEEFGATSGLALLGGRVTELPAEVPRPHIGWNRLEVPRSHALLEGLERSTDVYFVHSFAPDLGEEGETIATALHGRRFAAASMHGRVCGTQFHPEKSGDAGLRLLRNFLTLEETGAACS